MGLIQTPILPNKFIATALAFTACIGLMACSSGAGNSDSGQVGLLTSAGKETYTGNYTVENVCPGWMNLELYPDGNCEWSMGWSICTPSYAEGKCVLTGSSLTLNVERPTRYQAWRRFHVAASGETLQLSEIGSGKRFELRRVRQVSSP